MEGTKFRTQFDSSIIYPDRWDYDPIEGFQEHAALTISQMLQKFAAGESIVAHESANVNRSTYFQDPWDAVDEIQSLQQQGDGAPGNSEFSAEPATSSPLPKALGGEEILAQTGNSEIADGAAGSQASLSES